MVPDSSFYEHSAIIFSIILTFLAIFVIYINLCSFSKPLFTFKRATFFILLILALYIISLNISPQRIPGLDDYIFFNTLPILELVIYLIIFIIINYFIELCFLLDDEKGIVGEALWLNYFLTTFIFLLFIFLFPKMSDASSLNISDYYKTIAGILGTVLALIVTFSGQFPKNIFLPIIQSSDQFEYKHKLNVTDLFPYPKRIQYFVSLYSATLGISILGQVIGVPIHFNALILDPLNRDLSYLTSLAGQP